MTSTALCSPGQTLHTYRLHKERLGRLRKQSTKRDAINQDLGKHGANGDDGRELIGGNGFCHLSGLHRTAYAGHRFYGKKSSRFCLILSPSGMQQLPEHLPSSPKHTEKAKVAASPFAREHDLNTSDSQHRPLVKIQPSCSAAFVLKKWVPGGLAIDLTCMELNELREVVGHLGGHQEQNVQNLHSKIWTRFSILFQGLKRCGVQSAQALMGLRTVVSS